MGAWQTTAGQIAGAPDLWWAAGAIAAAAVLSFFGGRAFAAFRPAWSERCVAIGLACLASYLLTDLGPFWTLTLSQPWSFMAIHWPTLALAASAGVVLRHAQWSRSFRRSLAAGLLVMSAAPQALPLIRPCLDPCPLAARDQWLGDLCMQTSPVSCSPAAAATFLHLHGIESSESELARQCLTHGRGTSTIGLYYGLNQAAQPHGYRVWAGRVGRPRLASNDRYPAVINVRFADAGPPSRWNWTDSIFSGNRAARHTVVLLGPHPAGGWRIADPAFGLDRWSDEQLAQRWTGETFWIERIPGR